MNRNEEDKYDKLLRLMTELDYLVRTGNLDNGVDNWVAKDDADKHEKWCEFTAMWDMLNDYMEGQ